MHPLPTLRYFCHWCQSSHNWAGTPGASNLGGSGSNIREAYTVLSASLVPRRNTTLEDWALWRDFNGWDTDLEGFPNVNLTTLDKNPTVKSK
jgi:hypothetical protein